MTTRDEMTARLRRRPTGPFDEGQDPVCLEELSPAQLGWRAAMHLLALHGGSITVPTALAPTPTELTVAAGFQYVLYTEPLPDGLMAVRCAFVADHLAPPGACAQAVPCPPFQETRLEISPQTPEPGAFARAAFGDEWAEREAARFAQQRAACGCLPATDAPADPS